MLSRNGRWTIKLAVGETSSTSNFDGVIDLNGMGELIGVEILDFRRQTGAATPRPAAATPLNYGYDAEIDALYVHVARDTAPKQEKAKGTVALDVDDQIIGLTIDHVDH
jgi:uncharacterized protein YuzE